MSGLMSLLQRRKGINLNIFMSKEFITVTGLGIGEETKGASVEWLSKELNAHTITRSGGCQGGANVVLEDGREQMFSNFGAGTFNGVRTHLIHMVINPVDIFMEGIELEKKGVSRPFDLMTIDNNCLVLTPYHSAISRFREIMRDDKKGTVGKGVGEAIRDSNNPNISIRVKDFFTDKEDLKLRVEAIREYKLKQAIEIIQSKKITNLSEDAEAELKLLEDRKLVELTVDSYKALINLVKVVDEDFFDFLINKDGVIINESSHGALLHPWYGFVPHVTQIDPTSQDVLSTLKMHDYKGKIYKFGVSRCYATRHGAGPLVSFNPEMTKTIQETHNNRPEDNAWIGEFRNGNFDLVATKYASEISGGNFNGLMISYLDQLKRFGEWQVCEAYDFDGNKEGLSDYFNIENGIIRGIKVYPNKRNSEHLSHQLKLTQLLKQCRPVLKTLKPNKDKDLTNVFLDYIEEELQVPVVLAAFGPKMSDRVIRPGFEKFFNKDL